MAGAIATGVFINQLFDRVQGSIDQLKNAGLHLEMEAGAQIRQTIEQAKVAYADSLNLTMDRIDATARQSLDQLKTIVDDAQKKNHKMIREAARAAQQFANTLPLANTQPQLASISPHFVLSTVTTPIRIHFYGNFVHAPQPGYAPQLAFYGQSFTATDITTQKLTFSVPPRAVFRDLTPTQRGVVFGEGCLTTYSPAAILGRNQAEFHLTLGALPGFPGTFKLKYTKDRKETKEQDAPVTRHHIGSRSEDDNNDHIDQIVSGTPRDGWHVKRGTSRIVMIHSGGRHSGPHFVSEHGDQVIYKATTQKNTFDIGGKESGWLDFEIHFKEYQEITVPEPHEDDFNLKWGDTKALLSSDFPLGKWKVIFDAFDGAHHEFAGADSDTSPYFRIRSASGGHILEAVKPKELDDEDV